MFFLVLTVIREILTLLAILHLEIAKTFLLPAALSKNLTRPRTATLIFRVTAHLAGNLLPSRISSDTAMPS